ncbi:MAG TPA: hypothetical protein DCK76_09815 [Desulfotomaculum sp.]|nr:MAG: hypothetical protein XD84_0496 [Desulfotomaculum sp. 46_80]HAG11651.1 hypothetical protein [Desulfotomaculum sp.]HBY05076.1 hypothetical protein [Desulfotomaculum sp.]
MRKTYFFIFLVALIVGLMVTFQIRTINRAAQGVPAGRDQELTIEYRRLETEKANLRKEIKDLDSKLAQANKGQKEALSALKGELDNAKVAAGLVKITGPGIEITLDNPRTSSEAETPTLFTLRDEDLLRVVNELRIAGAEALSINGQRIVATTEIRYAAPFINVNLTRVVPPYYILAIGDPERLRAAMDISGGVVEYLRELGAAVDIQTSEDLTIPAYNGSHS